MKNATAGKPDAAHVEQVVAEIAAGLGSARVALPAQADFLGPE
jgi:hypothetical protein